MHEETFSNVSTAFLAWAEAKPDQSAIIFSQVIFSYAQLRDLSAAFAIRLKAAGIDEHASLLIRSSDFAVVIPTLLASAILGARVALWNAEEQPTIGWDITHEIVTLGSSSDVKQIVVDKTFSPHFFAPIEISRVWDAAKQIKANQPWLLIASSQPSHIGQIVGLTQSMILARSAASYGAPQVKKTRLTTLWPVTSYTFAARVLSVLLDGGTIIDPVSWLGAPELRATCLSAPIERLKPLFEKIEIDTKIDTLEVSAFALLDQEIAALRSGFCQIDHFWESAETGKVYSNRYSFLDDCGYERKGHAVNAAVEIGAAVNGTTGEPAAGVLKINADHMIDRYACPDGRLRSALEDGWFYPGLLSQWTVDGALEILGTIDDCVIEMGTERVKASLMDHLLKSCDGVVDAAIFENPKAGIKEVIGFVVYEEDVNRIQVFELMKQTCRVQFGEPFVPVKLWPIDKIPQTFGDVPDRILCAKMILEAADKVLSAQQYR